MALVKTRDEGQYKILAWIAALGKGDLAGHTHELIGIMSIRSLSVFLELVVELCKLICQTLIGFVPPIKPAFGTYLKAIIH